MNVYDGERMAEMLGAEGYVAAADGVEADFLFRAFAGEAGAAIDGDVLEVPAVSLGGGFAEEEGGARGGVLLAAVVAFDDFAVVAATGQGTGKVVNLEEELDL